VISEGLWRRRFGADPNILGKTVLLGGDPHPIVGIVGSKFDCRDLALAPDVWVPSQLPPNTRDQGHYFQVAGRLKPGITLQQARSRVVASAGEYLRKYPGALGEKGGFSIEPLGSALVQNVTQTLTVLAAAVGLVLLIACSNVANLLLARAIGRKREIAIRSAMGAGRGRLIRQLLTKSLILSTAGAMLGLVFGMIGIRALLSVNTANLPRVGRDGVLVTLDWRIVAFTAAAAVITAVLFGFIPALHVSRADLNAILKESTSRSGSGFRQNKARTLLAVGEIALAIILVTGAGLLIRTTLALQAVRPGFDSHNVLTMRMSLAGQRFLTSANIDRLIREGTERIRSVPGWSPPARRAAFHSKGAMDCRFSSSADHSRRVRFTAAADGTRFLPAISTCSKYPCCAVVRLPNRTLLRPLRWSSSTRPWPKSFGPKAIR
jgi:predicted permease